MASLEVKDDELRQPSTVFKCELPLCCDSVEWCHYQPFDSLIAVGHYELTNKQTKIGGITVFQYDSQNKSIKKLSFTQSAAILDLKWHSITSSNIILSTATTIGTIGLYSLNKKINSNLQQIHELHIPHNPVCLCLDWNDNNLCVTGTSDGNVCVFQFDDNKSKSSIISTINGHSDSVWTSCFDKCNEKIIYSGADDCVFGIWDYTSNKAIHKDETTHKMGICSITDSVKYPNILLTGSYDEYLRVWDKRNLEKPMNQLKFKDGVWRIKWCQNDGNTDKILIATMRDHFNIIQFDDIINQQNIKTLCSYTAHHDTFCNENKDGQNDNDVLCYGCDWSADNTIASCSFYDKQFHCWTYNS